MSGIANWLSGLLFSHVPSRGLAAYDRAAASSNDLLRRMHDASQSNDPIRGILADMWLERHNVAYSTSVYETHQEIMAAAAHKNAERKTEEPE